MHYHHCALISVRHGHSPLSRTNPPSSQGSSSTPCRQALRRRSLPRPLLDGLALRGNRGSREGTPGQRSAPSQRRADPRRAEPAATATLQPAERGVSALHAWVALGEYVRTHGREHQRLMIFVWMQVVFDAAVVVSFWRFA